MHANEMPAATQFFAGESEIEMPFLQSLVRIAFRMPLPAIPDHHGTAAIFALRDAPFELVVFNRVVLDVNGKTLLARNEARPARDRPALHDAVEFQPQVVMQPPGGMFLDHVAIALASLRLPARLRRDVELAFLPVGLQAHFGTRSFSPSNSRAMP